MEAVREDPSKRLELDVLEESIQPGEVAGEAAQDSHQESVKSRCSGVMWAA